MKALREDLEDALKSTHKELVGREHTQAWRVFANGYFCGVVAVASMQSKFSWFELMDAAGALGNELAEVPFQRSREKKRISVKIKEREKRSADKTAMLEIRVLYPQQVRRLAERMSRLCSDLNLIADRMEGKGKR